MNYERCVCGQMEALTSTHSPACRPCPNCGTVPAAGPLLHREPRPHRWVEEWAIDPQTGRRWRERRCRDCYAVEVVPGSEDPAP